MGDFSSKRGSVNSGNSTERGPKEGGVPATGFNESPKGECVPGGPGPGVGNTRRGIR